MCGVCGVCVCAVERIPVTRTGSLFGTGVGGIGGIVGLAVEKISVTRTGSLVGAGVGGIGGMVGPAVERIPVTRTGSLYNLSRGQLLTSLMITQHPGVVETRGEHVVGTGVDGTGGVVDPAGGENICTSIRDWEST